MNTASHSPASTACRETDRIREWESQVGVELMSKEARLQQSRKEQADLDAEVKQLMIVNGEQAHSIKTENDETRKISEEDATISELVSDLETELKMIQECLEEQDDCLNVCNMAQSYHNKEKEKLNDTFEGQKTTFTDQVIYYENEFDLLQSTKLRQSSEFEITLRGLKEKISKGNLEEENFIRQNEKGSSIIREFKNTLLDMNKRLAVKEGEVASLQKDFENQAENETNISIANKELSRQLHCKRQENYGLEEKCSKIGCETESIIKEIEHNTMKKNNLQLDVENHYGVLEELERLQEQLNEGLKKVNEYQLELEKLEDVKLQQIQADREKSNSLDELNLVNKELQATEGKAKEIENIELDKEHIKEEIARMTEQIDTEEVKRNQIIADFQMKVQALEEMKKQLDEEKSKLVMKKEIIQQRENLLREDLGPKLIELKDLQGQEEEQGKLLVAKEAEKKEKQISVMHITNEFHLQMKDNLDLLKIRLDSKLMEAKEIRLRLSNLENEATEKEQQCSNELEKITKDEEGKIDQAVKPVLLDYEETQLKKMQSEWQTLKEEKEQQYRQEMERTIQGEKEKANQIAKPILKDYKATQLKKMQPESQKFRSPLPSKQITFAKKGFNLETASPFDVDLNSQERTNRQPQLVGTSRMKVNADSRKISGSPMNQIPSKAGDSSRPHSNLDKIKQTSSAKAEHQAIVGNKGLSNRSQVTGSYFDRNQKSVTVTSHDLAHEKQATPNRGFVSGNKAKFFTNRTPQSSQEI